MLMAHGAVAEVMAMVRREISASAEDSTTSLDQRAGGGGRESDGRKHDRINVPDRGLSRPMREERLNARQRWFLEALTAGWEVRAADLRRHWGVSEKTARRDVAVLKRSEEHTSELQSIMRISYAVFCLKKKKHPYSHKSTTTAQQK